MLLKETNCMTADMTPSIARPVPPSTCGTLVYYANRLFNWLKLGQINRYFYYRIETSNLPRMPRGYEAAELLKGDRRLDAFVSDVGVQNWRFDQGCVCIGALLGGQLVGISWFAKNGFTEDEVRAEYKIGPSHVWDLGLEVGQEFRRTRAIAAVLGSLRLALEARGVIATFSRIADANIASLTLHDKLKGKKVGGAFFARIGQRQFCASRELDHMHVSKRVTDRPIFNFAQKDILQDIPQSDIISQLRRSAEYYGDCPALGGKFETISYAELLKKVEAFAAGIIERDACVGDRVAVWLPKQLETIVSIYGCAAAGLIFVPINPALKPAQVVHILKDSGARMLITSQARLASLPDWKFKDNSILVDAPAQNINNFSFLLTLSNKKLPKLKADSLAALLYTSGSTGLPKGVMLSHANIALGALSISHYLELTPKDRILSVMPLSFDYGLNQITSSFAAGASAYLLDHLFPQDVITAVKQHKITGLGVVPPLWIQLAALDLSTLATQLRYITNTGGRMPETVLRKLHTMLPTTKIFLMYGLTEAFRSTFLPPEKSLNKPASVGRAIPFAEVRVVRPDGSETDTLEIGELVHAGPLVAQGYWQDSERTALRFRPAPKCFSEVYVGTSSVWSGDQFIRDVDGDLFFVGRDDEMIKTSGYRVSPSEIEEAVYATGLSDEAVAFGIDDEKLGQIIGLIVKRPAIAATTGDLIKQLKQSVVNYMVPKSIEFRDELPRSPNGKIDRAMLVAEARREALAKIGRTHD
jgi:acyl-CoA ligase (AMP-forming) (exosortase A-associated)